MNLAVFEDASYPNAYFGSVIDLVGAPSSGHYRMMYIPYYANTEGYSVQVLVGAVGNTGLYWRKANGKQWGTWERAATSTPPQVYDLPLSEGITTAGETSYRKTQDGIIILNIGINRNAVQTGDGATIATLPVGFRPKGIVYFDASLQTTARVSCAMSIGSTGEVRMYANTSDNEWKRLFASVVYQI